MFLVLIKVDDNFRGFTEPPAPLLPPFGAEATALQALAPVHGHESMEIAFNAGALRVAVSPSRLRQLDAVAAQMKDSSEDSSQDSSQVDPEESLNAGDPSDLIDQDDTASMSGSDIFSDAGSVDVGSNANGRVVAARVSVLKVSFGRLRWIPCFVRLDAQSNSLLLFDGKGKHVCPATPLSGRGAGAMRFSKRAAAGQSNAICVCDGAGKMEEASSAMRAAEKLPETSRADSSIGVAAADHSSDRTASVAKASRIIRFRSETQSTRWKDLINDAAARAGGNVGAADVAVGSADVAGSDSSAREVEDSRNQAGGGSTVKISATLTELSVVIAAPLSTVSADPSGLARANSLGSDVFYDADVDEWWSTSGGNAEVAGSIPGERALVRLVLSAVAVSAVIGANTKDVNVSLKSLEVHDAFMSDKLGKPCRVLASSAASRVLEGSELSSSIGTRMGDQSSDGAALVVRLRSLTKESNEYAGVDTEVSFFFICSFFLFP